MDNSTITFSNFGSSDKQSIQNQGRDELNGPKGNHKYKALIDEEVRGDFAGQPHGTPAAFITKTCLFKYTEKLITEKLKIFRQKIQIFFIFLLKT